MQLSIITLNFRKPLLTIKCLKSLYKVYEKEFITNNFELIIVDNLSNDDSVEILKNELNRKKYQNCHLISNNKNDGFGAGNNLGVKSSKGEFILLLNNDTEVKSGLKEMVKFMTEHKDVNILGGQLTNTDGSKQSSSGDFYDLWHVILFLLGLQKFGLVDKSPSSITEVDWVKGALMMIKKTRFESLSGFDEKMFMYLEDMELCYRARKAGMKIYFYPNVEIIHQDQGSTNRTFAVVNIYKSMLYFYSKHKSSVEYKLVKFLLLSKADFVILIGMLMGNGELISRYRQAIKFK